MTQAARPTPEDVLAFWSALGHDRWFGKDDALDAQIKTRFLPLYEDAAAGKLEPWNVEPDGSLAHVIVLDQFSRNMFRGDSRTFAADPAAREAAKSALARGFDHRVAAALRKFFYLPFMHAEDLADQERCVALCETLDDADTLNHAKVHAEIIRRFGRFPHRNSILGRTTTTDEQAFLDSGGFSG